MPSPAPQDSLVASDVRKLAAVTTRRDMSDGVAAAGFRLQENQVVSTV